MARHALLRCLFGALALLLAAASALADTWPERPVRVIVPYPAGGVTDGTGRLVAEWLAQQLGQPVVVENRSGASGNLGAEQAAASRADGYTLLVASNSQFVFQQVTGTPRYDSRRDLAPISIVGRNPMVLMTRAELGARTLPEFVALLKRQPDRYSYSSSGAGNASHLAMVLFTQRSGTAMQHIPYRGGAPAMADLIAGVVAAHIANPSDAVPHLGAGAVLALATTGRERSAALPQVPSMAELGYPGAEVYVWNALAAPAGTPAPVLARLAAAMQAGCRDAGFRARVERLGAEPLCSTPAGMAATIEAEIPLWRDVIREARLTFD